MTERRVGRPPKGQKHVEMIRVNYRFQPSTVKALQKVARKNKITQTEFVEQAVIEKIERSGIIKPKPPPRENESLKRIEDQGAE
jgi:hypothetical protein